MNINSFTKNLNQHLQTNVNAPCLFPTTKKRFQLLIYSHRDMCSIKKKTKRKVQSRVLNLLVVSLHGVRMFSQQYSPNVTVSTPCLAAALLFLYLPLGFCAPTMPSHSRLQLDLLLPDNTLSQPKCILLQLSPRSSHLRVVLAGLLLLDAPPLQAWTVWTFAGCLAGI